MGRRRKHDRDLPAGMRRSHGAYYHVVWTGERQEWVPLGRDRKAEAEGYQQISCWVADDIPANEFWRSMGFRLSGSRPGGARRGRMHNLWIYQCAEPMQLRLIA